MDQSGELTPQVSMDNQKKAIQIKFLLEMPSDSNQQELKTILNGFYPFTEYPLDRCPPIELIQSEERKILGHNLSEQLQKYCYIVIKGGISIKKKSHEYIENRFLSSESQQDIFFNIKDPEVVFSLVTNSCIIRIHNIWVEMMKKRKKTKSQDYIKQKLMKIDFFSNLTFEQFFKCCQLAEIKILGPSDILLKNGDLPYYMIIVAEGELVFERRVKVIRNYELWRDFQNQLPIQEDGNSQLMFQHLIKQPRPTDETFQVDFRIKNINEGDIICGRQTLMEQRLTYTVLSTLKTKIIQIRYPDLYNLTTDRLSQIRSWPAFQIDDRNLRRDYFYQTIWDSFKSETKEEAKLNKMQKQKFQDFLRKNIKMNPEKSYYMANKVGQGSLIDNAAGKISKLQSISYQKK